ncbi:MAG: glycosyltransferase family 2 protein [Bacteroides sp.]|nr:glycosyltransferase family 2 protein [Bacteroides sp.]MCM1094726.1 glycosyltransferase family 2 protein [Terasakiella sp.]
MKTLTVFTPAYNRAHTIGRTYESLCRQTSRDFEWLVVDDGSSDNTAELVRGWIDKADFPIRYIRQENQGMHGAHNTAYANIHTELNVCIDSDDWMPDDAVEKIVVKWRAEGSDKYSGIIGLDIDSQGDVIGTRLPEGVSAMTLDDFYTGGGRGDKKLVYRTDLMKSVPPYPLFPGEKYVGLGYKGQILDQSYKMLLLDEPLVVVEYQTDGSSMNMYRQYWRNPRGFAFMRLNDMLYARTMRRKVETCIHYVSHSLRARNARFISQSNMPLLTALCILPGIALYAYTAWKVKSNQKMALR